MERRLWGEGWSRVAGVDEVGRGPLAGPVVAGAVVLPGYSRARWVRGLRDSKQLDAPTREVLAASIRRHCDWGIGVVSSQVIDQIGIAPATRLAMWRALASLERPPEALIIDGRERLAWPGPTAVCRQQAVVDGDALCVSVAAASIIAKVHRDALMRALDSRFPGYGLAQHKGYATPEHLQALRERGSSTIHRYSFQPVRDAIRRGAAC